MDVAESVINAAQKILKRQLRIGGCQSTALAHSLKFCTAPADKMCVQVLHTGTVGHRDLSLVFCFPGVPLDNRWHCVNTWALTCTCMCIYDLASRSEPT